MKYGWRRWNWGVSYKDGATQKDKHFKDEEEAREFYEKKRKFLHSPILFRFRPENFFENLVRGHVLWLGIKIPIWYFIYLLLMTLIITLWRMHE